MAVMGNSILLWRCEEAPGTKMEGNRSKYWEEKRMILYYRNSFVASMISLVGCMMIAGGIADGWNIGLILLGIPFLIGGKLYSNWVAETKSFEKWWKQVENANLVSEIAKSTETAVAVYKKNPQERTLEKIRELNPAAAAYIENGYREPAAQNHADARAQQAQVAVQQSNPVQQTAQRPQPIQQPVSKPEEKLSDIDADIENVMAAVNANIKGNNDPELHWEDLQKLEDMFTRYPNHEKLRQNVITMNYLYAATALQMAEKSFDKRRQVFCAALRSVELQRNPDPMDIDYNVWLIVYNAVHGTIEATHAEDRVQMIEAMDWVKSAAEYRIRGKDETLQKLMPYNDALTVCRPWLAFWLANSYRKEPEAKTVAMWYIDEALRYCPAKPIRQCDLNPKSTITEVILSKEDIQQMKRIISGM